jgi:hypothetical protein
VEVHDTGKLDFSLVRPIEPVSDLSKNVGIASVSIVKARRVNEKTSLTTNPGLVYAYIDCALVASQPIVIYYPYSVSFSRDVLQDSSPSPTLAVLEKCDMKVLFPTPVIPMTPMTMSFELEVYSH